METVFPSIITENFDIEKIRLDAKAEELHVDLVEKNVIPREFSARHVISHGYTEPRKIQDFPIRGNNAVYLHVKRRKWQDMDTGEILTRRYDITHEGTGLTREFVVFLKRQIESSTLSVKTVGRMYGVDGDNLSRQYKRHISGFGEWEWRDVAEAYVLFEKSLGPRLSMDETCLS